MRQGRSGDSGGGSGQGCGPVQEQAQEGEDRGQTVDGSPADAPHGSEPAASPVSVGEDLPEWLRAWDRYEVLSFLGQGGMGVVYRARDRRLRRIVALKFIRAVSPQLAQRFGKEARAQARINHENICKVFEVGEVSGQKYIAMEYLSGEPLHRASARMTMPQKLTLIKEIAQALHAAHRQGIIHRDIKPAEVAGYIFRR